MNDSISQAMLDSEKDLPLPVDALEHERIAASVLEMAAHLDPGAVVAVQGSWGRGKTDVLKRVAQRVKKGDLPAWTRGALWINPWQYGTPDLLGPLVIALARRVPKDAWNSATLRKALESLVRASLNFGIKASATTVPGGALFKELASPADDLLKGLFAALDDERSASPSGPDADPVAAMGERFKELVEAVIPESGRSAGARLLVCVDDLDRCMPDRQVALLEAVHFLITSGAPATFVMAIDPALARQAVVAHFQTNVFDPDRYLDKMFDLRVNLPAVDPRGLGQLFTHHLAREVRAHEVQVRLGQFLDGRLGPNAARTLATEAPTALPVTELRNPRVVRRLMDRLHLWAIAGRRVDPAPNAEDLRNYLTWLGMVERWPELRVAVQDAGAEGFRGRFGQVWERYAAEKPEQRVSPAHASAVRSLPPPEREPALVQVMQGLGAGREAAERRAAVFLRFDQELVRVGL